MLFDVTIFPTNLNTAGDLARQVEDYGFDGLWTAETAHNPFLPLTHAAAATRRISLGTAIAVAFPRSPMVTAGIAWDLAEQSKGRFVLGLGTQVKAHITRRFSTEWNAPVPRLREYIESMRAIWNTWQNGAPLRYQGEHYKFTLMTPFFAPTPMPYADIPVYIAGVNEGLCRLAGELCQGFHVHAFHTPRYLKEVIIPAIESGLQKTGRARADIRLSCAIFVVTGSSAEEMQNHAVMAKSQIAFYASTPSYAAVMELHGWGDLAQKLNAMSREGRWSEMWQEISDDMLDEFAVVAPPDELPHKMKERYDGLLDRVGYYLPFVPEETDKKVIWDSAARVFG
ncbi:MAG: TIGR03617 family F420-dependent LLM class oxidoreductase [Chloroflexi bacterium]|nr:TIGR03617 family F420-dependent LLM class oxidoreductase [Chloroflexota bacterium]MDL1885708.1 TIGR03617 family F420-dependent LLM class oxidoreductase [Anaerolineae bacterium CFX8]